MERSRPSSEARRTMWRKRARYSNATAARSIISENSAPAKSAKRSTICCTGPHCVANYEAILLGKVYGLDALKVRETWERVTRQNRSRTKMNQTRIQARRDDRTPQDQSGRRDPGHAKMTLAATRRPLMVERPTFTGGNDGQWKTPARGTRCGLDCVKRAGPGPGKLD